MRFWKSATYAGAVAAVVLFMDAPAANGQAPVARRNTAQSIRMPDGKPNLTGLWQTTSTADWDIQDHSAQAGPFYQLGAIGAIPPGQGIVEGGEIPYLPAALVKRKDNLANRWKNDPELKCYMPGLPRATYMPYPLQIIQSQKDIVIAYEYATTNRLINMGKPQEAAVDTWMGTSNGHWEGDTLVVDVTGFNGMAWFDRSGNYASDGLHVVERYSASGCQYIELRSHHRGPQSIQPRMEDQPASLPASRKECAASGVQVRGVRRRASLWQSSEEIIGGDT